jgi:aldose 1-epimerase
MAQFVRLEATGTRVTIAPELGGRLAQIEAMHRGAWTPLLHEPADIRPEERDPTSWGSFPMAPWPNRIALGTFEWRGETVRIPPNLEGHAAHGVCFDRPWRVDATSDTSCEESIEFDERWPFGGRAVQRFEVLDDGVVLTLEVHAGATEFPAGVGWHPWFRRDVSRGSHVHAHVDAGRYYELEAHIPTGRVLPSRGDRDLRNYPLVGDRRLDDCYQRPSGPMRLRWGDDLELWMESSTNATHAVVYTPENAICLEPQTCAIDAFNLDARGANGTGVAIVTPAQPLIASTAWRWSGVQPSTSDF